VNGKKKDIEKEKMKKTGVKKEETAR